MVIRNSDGSIFKLNGPNPVMKSQKTWNGFILHNMDWNPYVFGEGKIEKKDKNNVDNYKDSFLDELEKSQSPQPAIPQPTAPQPAIPQPTAPQPAIPQPTAPQNGIKIPKILCYCLPAKEEKKTDFLYDEVYKSISYDEPFILEIVITEETDVSFECWTTVDKVDVGSILYPKNKMKRWWKVTSRSYKTGGYLLKATISQYQPSFDD